MYAEGQALIRGLPGHRFGVFGRGVGARLIAAGQLRAGGSLLLSPVSSVRYWEFDFADRQLARGGYSALDISSPRLLALYLTHRGRFKHVVMANPDPEDLTATTSIIGAIGLEGIVTLRASAVEASASGLWDAVWSISVVEHIAGDSGDSMAVSAMFRSLRPGGVLVLTVPVDRRHWDEYRSDDVYGLGADPSRDGYFFQRYYDAQSIEHRLIDGVGCRPDTQEWFGETSPGVFAAYERRWMERGLGETVGDPAFIASNFRSYGGWAEMPGMGVCGMTFRKPGGEA